MTYEQLDFIFPFFVLLYGAMMTFTLNHPKLMQLAEERIPGPMLIQFKAHRWLGLISLVLGGLWSLQNIWQ